MNDTDPGTMESTPRSRLGWWISGGVMWALVAVAMATAWKLRPSTEEENEPVDPAMQPIVIEKPVKSGPAPKALRPEVPRGTDGPQWNPKGIEDFSLTERSGRAITKKDLLGRPWVVGFVFTTCAGPCLTVSGQMSQLQEKFAGTDIRLVTISVLPEVDTPEVLSKYADAFGADPDRWLFLTGDKKKIYHLIQDSFQMPVKELTGPDRLPGWEVVHTTNLLYVDANGVVQGKYDGKDPLAVAQLVEALLNGPAEAEIPETAIDSPAEDRP